MIERVSSNAEGLEYRVGVVLVLLNDNVVFDEELVGGLEGGDYAERGEGNKKNFDFDVGIEEVREH